jgi:hypothetical protein
MPIPEGFITTSKIWTGEPQDVQLPEEPTEVEQKEEEREEALRDVFSAYKDYIESKAEDDQA